MGFEFKPSIWFVCRYCRQAFRYLFKLKEHRVENHLGECLKTKCLIFEERSLDHEWIPSPDEIRCDQIPSSSSAHISNRGNSSYKNPYVSLEQLSPQQLNVSRNESPSFSGTAHPKTKSRSCRGTKRTADRLTFLRERDDDEPCAEKKCNLDVDHVEITTTVTTSNITVFDSKVPKVELTIEEFNQLPENAVLPTSSSNLASQSNEEDQVRTDAQGFELEDREFIVASIVKSSDGTGNIQFMSTSDDLDLLHTTDKKDANTELPNTENEINSGVTSAVLDFQTEKENNGHIILETENLFKHDDDSICEVLLPEEYSPTDATNLNQTEIVEEIVGDSEHTECPDNIERSSEDWNNDIDPGPTSQGHSEINQALLTVKLTPEELSLPLLDWLHREKVSDPFNVILLYPDPTSETLPVGVNDLWPMKCVLCTLELTSETVKEHVKVCWAFNKAKHVYCVLCKKAFWHPSSLKRHCKNIHFLPNLITNSALMEAIDDTEVEAPEINSNASITELFRHRSKILNPHNLISESKCDEPLKEWLALQKEEKHSDGSTNVVLIDPDPTLSDLDPPDIIIDKEHPLTCILCQVILFNDSELRNHVENCWWHNKDKHRRCVPCEFTFETPKLLRDHQTFDHAKTILDTNEESEDSEVEKVDDNKDVIHVGLAEWLKKRQLKSSNVIRLDPDPTQSTGPTVINTESPIQCKLCGTKLVSESAVKRHVSACWRYKKKNHRYCVPCETAFSDKANLNKHNCTEHFGGPEFLYTCTTCRTGFKDIASKRIHTFSLLVFLNRIVHGKYAESSTATSKPQETSLVEWLRQQKEENPSNCIVLEPDPLSVDHNFEGVSKTNPVKCKLCCRKFTSELVLRSHVRICWIHNRRIHRHCVKCNKTYASMARLKWHKKLKHPRGSKPMYECNVCGRKYVSLFRCKIHQESHTNPDKAKPFKCETCSNSFRWKSQLDTHMLSHYSEMKFKCPHCPKTFINKHFEDHLAVHTPGKDDTTDSSKPSGTPRSKLKFKCEVCGKGHPTKSTLRKHKETHNDDEDESDEFETGSSDTEESECTESANSNPGCVEIEKNSTYS